MPDDATNEPQCCYWMGTANILNCRACHDMPTPPCVKLSTYRCGKSMQRCVSQPEMAKMLLGDVSWTADVGNMVFRADVCSFQQLLP